jgi:hypothetical protein
MAGNRRLAAFFSGLSYSVLFHPSQNNASVTSGRGRRCAQSLTDHSP